MVSSAKSFGTLVLLSVAIFCSANSFAQTAPKSRINVVDNTQQVAMHGSVHPLAKAEFDHGRVDGGMKVNGVTLTFRLSEAQQSALKNLLQEQQDPASPSYHKWLTPEEYAAQFGMADSDIRKVTSWLQSQGLTVDSVSRSRTEISFSGTASQVESAFKTEIHHYVVKGETHFANVSDTVVPAAIAAVTLSIRNLNDFRPKPKNIHVRRVPASSPHYGFGTGSYYLSPADFATIYDINATGLDGTGQTIAVVGQTGLTTNGSGALTDIDAFRTAAGLPARTAGNFQIVTVPSTGKLVVSQGDIDEANLDLEWTGAIAKNANIVFVSADQNSGKSVWDALSYAINQKVAMEVAKLVTARRSLFLFSN
jgi:subtilase family serine protease